jgi:hypothetical protein
MLCLLRNTCGSELISRQFPTGRNIAVATRGIRGARSQGPTSLTADRPELKTVPKPKFESSFVYFRFGAKDWFGKAEAGGRCTTMKPRFDPWWQLLQAAGKAQADDQKLTSQPARNAQPSFATESQSQQTLSAVSAHWTDRVD